MPYTKVPAGYQSWQGMKQRCLNPNNIAYLNYGGRGITICDSWVRSFNKFITDMGLPPEKHSLERVDNDLGYSPENCVWATKKEQQRNQRWTRKVVIDGVEHKAVELAEKAGLKTDTVMNRAADGCSMEEILKPEKRPKKDMVENVLKMVAGNKRRTDAITHCPQGHEYSEKNTYITKEGWRSCRPCKAAKRREREARKRTA